MRVLVVDDDAALRDNLGRSLEADGWESEGAATVEDAIERLSERHFDLVVTDYNLGSAKTGLVLLGHLRKEEYNLPAIFISGYGEKWLEDAARERGAFAFFVKPFAMEPFFGACRQAHEKHAGSQDRH